MLSQVLNLFKIDTDFDLNIMSKNQSLNEISSKIFKRIDPVLDSYNPDLVLVHGTQLLRYLLQFLRSIRR